MKAREKGWSDEESLLGVLSELSFLHPGRMEISSEKTISNYTETEHFRLEHGDLAT